MDKAAPADPTDQESGVGRRQTSGFDLRPSEADRVRRDQRLKGLVLQHFDSVWRMLRRLGVPDADLDDASQEVFLVASRRLDEIELNAERSFLLGTAVRIASSSRRAVSRRRESADLGGTEPLDPGPGPEELVSRARCRQALQDILTDMSDEHRAVFVLFELEQLPVSQIAELLAIAPGTVASRLRRARELFFMQAKRYQARQAFEENQ